MGYAKRHAYFLTVRGLHPYCPVCDPIIVYRSREVGKRFTPATPPSFQSPTHAYPRPSLMGPSPSHPPPIPPLHNTVTIVQQPAGGQSLYVQQQIFTPSSYIPPVTMTTRVEPFLAVQPPMVATLQVCAHPFNCRNDTPLYRPHPLHSPRWYLLCSPYFLTPPTRVWLWVS